MHPVRISAPASTAPGMWLTRMLLFAPTLQPSKQNPRMMQCGRLPARPAGMPTGPPATTGMPSFVHPSTSTSPAVPACSGAYGYPCGFSQVGSSST